MSELEMGSQFVFSSYNLVTFFVFGQQWVVASKVIHFPVDNFTVFLRFWKWRLHSFKKAQNIITVFKWCWLIHINFQFPFCSTSFSNTLFRAVYVANTHYACKMDCAQTVHEMVLCIMYIWYIISYDAIPLYLWIYWCSSKGHPFFFLFYYHISIPNWMNRNRNI